MVLEGTPSQTSQDTFDQSVPANDEDPFATSQPGVSRYRVDQSLLRPFPILGPLFGHSQATWDRTLQQFLRQAQQAVRRPLTQDEVDAYAYWTARAISQSSYGAPLGMAGGCYAAYISAQKFRFPFWQPNLETFNPEVFPPKQAIFRGNRAVMAWHALRMLSYSTLGGAIGGFMMSSYAISSSIANQYLDKRLREVNEALVQRLRSQRGTSRPQMQQHRVPRQAEHDDASPSSGMYRSGNAEIGRRQDSEGPNDDHWREEKPREKPWRKSSRPPPLEEVHENQDAGYAVYDDASPTGGRGVSADTASQQTSGSAWDRLRRGEKPIQNRQTETAQREDAQQQPSQSVWSKLRNRPQQGMRDKSNTDENYSYSETYEQRELTKAQAQREFDAQVERERRGGDFNDSGENQKRW
jgi:hypothetical protein